MNRERPILRAKEQTLSTIVSNFIAIGTTKPAARRANAIDALQEITRNMGPLGLPELRWLREVIDLEIEQAEAEKRRAN